MGRFDALTQIEEKEPKARPSAASSPITKEERAPFVASKHIPNKELKTLDGEVPDLPANQQTSKLVNQQTSKEFYHQTRKPVSQQVDIPTNQQAGKPVSQQTVTAPLSTKEKKKYSTYLREDSILSIQILAAQSRQKDHELLQEIVDHYFETTKR